MNRFVSHSENETIEFGKKIAALLQTGDVIVLSGDLGSGKTKFTQGILSHFNLQDEIASPTFTIVNEHHTKNLNLYHFDVYRLADLDEFYAIGGEEYLEKGICLIEWGEMIENILPPTYLKIQFSRVEDKENERVLELIPHGVRFTNLIQSLT